MDPKYIKILGKHSYDRLLSFACLEHNWEPGAKSLDKTSLDAFIQFLDILIEENRTLPKSFALFFQQEGFLVGSWETVHSPQKDIVEITWTSEQLEIFEELSGSEYNLFYQGPDYLTQIKEYIAAEQFPLTSFLKMPTAPNNSITSARKP